MSTNSAVNTKKHHESVMLQEVLKYMSPQNGDIIVDATFGAGGHTKAMLDSADCTVVGIDRDNNAQKYIEKLKAQYGNRFVFAGGKFGDIESLLSKCQIKKVDGILLDVGVSSMQIDNSERGFSFYKDGPLDMRMGNNGEEETAADIVNFYPENEIADIIYRYGDDRKSRRIARAIVLYRENKSIKTTLELAEIVTKAVGRYSDTIHPATRTFQALRIYVNDELRELERVLVAAEKLLSEGGRLVVITFHSGEDIILKQFLRQRSGKMPSISRHLPAPSDNNQKPATFALVVKKAIKPKDIEVAANPRARSAKMRVAKRVNVSPLGNSDDSFNVQVGG